MQGRLYAYCIRSRSIRKHSLHSDHFGMRAVVITLSLLAYARSDSFTYIGCFSRDSVSGLSLESTDQYQSSSLCQKTCSDNTVAALLRGNECYCGDDVPSTDDMVSDSNCNTACYGWPYENCGSSKYYSLYSTEEASDGSSEGSSSSIDRSSTSSTQSSSRSQTSSQASLISSSSASSSTTTSSQTKASSASSTQTARSSVSTITSKTESSTAVSTEASSTQADQVTSFTSTGAQQTIVVTKSESSSQPSASSAPQSRSANIGGGAIAGIVVGIVGGLFIIIAAAFLLLRRRKKGSEEFKDNNDQGTISDYVKNNAYRFSRENTLEKGTRRFSDESLPDVRHKTGLRIANPDSGSEI